LEVPPITEPDCRRCAHYYITYDVRFRYGCHALGFKSQRLPMYAVMEASGEPCLAFTLKKRLMRPRT